MAIITKSFTITGNTSGLYELPEVHLTGSAVSKSLDHKVVEERIKDEYVAFYFYRCAANWCLEQNYKKAYAFFVAEIS